MGHCPEWYAPIRTARYLGVAPWELLKQPIAWMEWAAIAENAENGAQQSMMTKGEADGRN